MSKTALAAYVDAAVASITQPEPLSLEEQYKRNLEEQYKRNKMRVGYEGYTPTCSKCRHRIRGSQKYYQDVMTNLPAHITCPRKQKEAPNGSTP